MHEKRYRITDIEKYNKINDVNFKKAGIGCLVSGILVTMMHYGNFNIEIRSLYTFFQTIATIIFSSATLASIVATFKKFLDISKVNIEFDRLQNDIKLAKLNNNNKKNYVINKIKKYNEEYDYWKKWALTTGAVAIGLLVANNLIGYPLADSLDYGTLEIGLAQLVTSVVNVIDVGAIGATTIALAQMAGFSKEQMYLEDKIKEDEYEDRITR